MGGREIGFGKKPLYLPTSHPSLFNLHRSPWVTTRVGFFAFFGAVSGPMA